MYTFNDFIDEKSKEALTENQSAYAFNVMVLYQQYIHWVLNKQKEKNEKHTMKAADLLFQLQIINAYQMYYAKETYSATLRAMPEIINVKEMKDHSQEISTILENVKNRAITIFKLNEVKILARNEVIAICASIILGTLMAVLHPQVDAYLGAYLALGTFLALTVINMWVSIVSGIIPNKKSLSKAYDTAVILTNPRVQMSRLYLEPQIDNGYGQALAITSNAMLTAWRDSFVHRCRESELMDLKQVSEQIDMKIKQRIS